MNYSLKVKIRLTEFDGTITDETSAKMRLSCGQKFKNLLSSPIANQLDNHLKENLQQSYQVIETRELLESIFEVCL